MNDASASSDTPSVAAITYNSR